MDAEPNVLCTSGFVWRNRCPFHPHILWLSQVSFGSILKQLRKIASPGCPVFAPCRPRPRGLQRVKLALASCPSVLPDCARAGALEDLGSTLEGQTQ